MFHNSVNNGGVKMVIKNLKSYLIVFMALCLSACNNGNNATSSDVASNLNVMLKADQLSYVPLINGKSTSFYYYVNNPSDISLNGIKWSLKNLNGNAVAVLSNASTCSNIAANGSCALLITATAPGSVELQGVMANGKIIQFNGSNTIQVQNLNLGKTQSGNLVFVGLQQVNFSKGKNLSFFVVNTGASSIKIEDKYLVGMPANVNPQIAMCQNPLGLYSVCQLRLQFKDFNSNLKQKLLVPLNLQAKIQGSNGSWVKYIAKNYPIVFATNAEEKVALSSAPLANNLMQSNALKVSALKVSSTITLPSVAPNLSVTSALFNSLASLVTSSSQSYQITLTNNSTVSGGADGTLSIPYTSLVPPEQSGLTYSVNTSGVSSPCNGLPTSAASANFFLARAATCSYNLVITTGTTVMSSTPQTITTAYKYYVYTGPSTKSYQNAPSSLTNSFNVKVDPRFSQLGVALASSGTVFSAVEQGTTPNPRTITLTITNSGNAAYSGTLTATGLPTGITFTPSGACSSIAAGGGTCSAILSMSTTNVISAGNLNSVVVNYNNGLTNTSTPLPSGINYEVVAVNQPAITMATSVSGCFVGTGDPANICYNNPNNMGGTANGIKVTLTFTNTSSNLAKSLALSTAALANFTSQGYTVTTNTCSSGVPANNGTCTMVFGIASTAGTQALQPNVVGSSFLYTATYGSQSQFSVNFNGNVNVNVNVVVPTLVTAAIANMVTNANALVVATMNWSNLYQASTPSTITSVTNTSNASVSGLSSASPATCTAISSAGASCTSVISAPNVPANTYVFKASAFSGIVSAANVNFKIINPVIFMTTGTYTGNLGGLSGADAKCQTEAYQAGTLLPINLTATAILVSSTRYPCDNTGLCAGTHASNDWPLGASKIYSNPSGTNFNTTNANAIFDGSVTAFYDSKGAAIANNQYFWSGAQSVYTNASATDIAAWAYVNESTASSIYYPANLNDCTGYTTPSSTAGAYAGSIPNVGVVGLAAGNYAPSYNIPGSAWGNFFNFWNQYMGYVYNVWSGGTYAAVSSGGLSLPACANAYHLVCVAK